MISNIRGIVCVIVTLSAVFVLASRTDLFAENVEPQGDNVVKYEANWESLKKYGYDQKAEWLKDAKFGIYTHWGPSTYPISMCPVVAGWYPRRMYETFFSNGRVFEFHKETFGDQHKVGYKDLIPLFKAEKFDAEEWARLFKEAGARFAGPVASHHDNFLMWNSKCSEWDSVDKGPKRDISRELKKAIQAQGMKFVMTLHHAGAWNYYTEAYKFDAADPKYVGLYTEPHKFRAPATENFLDLWFTKVKEVVNGYSPDLLWFDACMGGVIPVEHRQKMAAYCYNKADERKHDFILAYKRGNLGKGTALVDHEVRYPKQMTDHFWLTDWSVTGWFPFKHDKYTTSEKIIHRLADIISKNGALMLNIPPDHTGSINDKSRNILADIGAWLKINGEAVYETRPWRVFGTGPNLNAEIKPAWKGGQAKSVFTWEDVRFTQSKDGKTVYAIVLGWPPEGKVTMEALLEDGDKIREIGLLGHTGTLAWEKDSKGIVIQLPDDPPCENAIALKVSLK